MVFEVVEAEENCLEGYGLIRWLREKLEMLLTLKVRSVAREGGS